MIDKALSVLPFDGYKSFLGALLMLAAQVWPGQPWGEVNETVEVIGNLLLALGLFHKSVKERP